MSKVQTHVRKFLDSDSGEMKVVDVGHVSVPVWNVRNDDEVD